MEYVSWRVLALIFILGLFAVSGSKAAEEDDLPEKKENDISPVIPLLGIGLGSVLLGFFIAVICIFCPCCPWYKRRRSLASNSEERLVDPLSGNIPFIKISPTPSVPDVHIIDISQNVAEIDAKKLDMALRKGSRISVHYY